MSHGIPSVHSSTSTSEEPPLAAPAPRLRTLGLLIAGLVAALLMFEIVLRILPVPTSTATGYYYDPLILTYPAGHRFWVASGWNLERARSLTANNFGFVADHDFVPDPNAIALIGDSFVEASMLPDRERLGPQIESRVAPRRVYAMGSPGTALLDYGERMRFASEHFGIHDFVLFLEQGDIAQSLCGSGNIHARCVDPATLAPTITLQAPPGRVKLILRNSALAQYLFSQLKLDPAAWLHKLVGRFAASAPAAKPRASAGPSPEAVQRVLTEFFERSRPYRTGKLILVWTGSLTSRRAANSAADPVEAAVIEAANRNGAMVVRIAPSLESYRAQTGLSLQVSPHDGHFNGIAMSLIADQVAPLFHIEPSVAR